MDAAEASLADQLQAFRAAHRLRTVDCGAATWTYADTAGDGPLLLLLPGLGGTATAMFPVVQALAKRARVLSVGYPRGVHTVAAALAGLNAILDAAEVPGPAVVVGHSLGAALAQSLARSAPQRVRSLALANFGIYVPLRGRLLARTLRLLERLPDRVRARLVAVQVRGLVPAGPAHGFWTHFLGDELASQWRVLRDQVHLLGDLLRQPPFTRAELASWGGRVLLLEGEDDSGFEPEEQTALRQLHPQATVHVFPGAGHLSWLDQPEAFAAEVLTLLSP